MSFSTTKKSPTKSSTAESVAAELASHVHHSSPNLQLPLPPVEPSRRLSSSPNPSLTSKSKRPRLDKTEPSITPLKTSFDQDSGQSMQSAGSMQTPPPTSTSASRRKAQQAQVARLVKESAEKGRRMSFPALTNKIDNMDGVASQVEESPQQYAALQFSPDGFAFPASGPATAPVYPQHKLFWDPEQNGDMNIDFPMDDTFATFGVQKSLDPFVSDHEVGGINFPTSPALHFLGTSAENLTSADDSGHNTPTAPSATMERKPSRGNGVDPSLLFSSPGRAAEASSMPMTSQKIQDDNLLPYAHQLRDAQMELEMQMSRKPKRKRGPETDSPAVEAALQTLRDDQVGIKRNIADDLNALSATQRPSSRNSLGRSKDHRVVGQKALQKQRSRNRLDASDSVLPQHKRTSVTFTIDANGRAKTETRVLTRDSRPPSDSMEFDSDGESDSTSSSSNDGMTMSQPQSFAYPQQQKQPRMGRFIHNSQSHSQKSSYASTLSSTKNARTTSEATRRRPSSNLFIQSNIHNQSPRVSFNTNARAGLESEAETVIDSEDDKGDAQSALKKVLQSRQKSDGKRSRSRNGHVEQQSAYPPPNALAHPYYVGESFTPTGNTYGQAYNNISPTTITDPDLTTPTSGRSNISSDSVRCLCHTSEDDGQLMIQW